MFVNKTLPNTKSLEVQLGLALAAALLEVVDPLQALLDAARGDALHVLREMGGAPRNTAPGNHFLARIVEPSSCHCTDGHLTGRVVTED